MNVQEVGYSRWLSKGLHKGIALNVASCDEAIDMMRSFTNRSHQFLAARGAVLVGVLETPLGQTIKL